MNRFTFVLHVHPGGISTLENVSTDERVRVADIGAVGPQIERWVEALADDGASRASSRAEARPRPRSPR